MLQIFPISPLSASLAPFQRPQLRKSLVFHLGFFTLLWLTLLTSGCASNNASPTSATSFEQMGGYALDGPDFMVIADLSGLPLQGTMQRKAMVGVGKLKLYSTEEPPRLICESVINMRPNEKRRVRGILDCNDGNILLFTLRPLGPDQGLGIGTSANASDTPNSGKSENPKNQSLQEVNNSSSALFQNAGTYKDLTLFYHPSKEEAERRFPQILQDFTELRQQKRP